MNRTVVVSSVPKSVTPEQVRLLAALGLRACFPDVMPQTDAEALAARMERELPSRRYYALRLMWPADEWTVATDLPKE